MKVLVLHRYPIDLVIGTNPSFPIMLELLNEKVDEIFFLSFKGNSKEVYPDITFEEVDFSFDRSNSFDKILKSFMWVILAPIATWKLAQRNKFRFIYCDDSFPFYPSIIKLLMKKRCEVIMRLGDMQTGYFLADQGILKSILFHIFHSIEIMTWKYIDRIVAISNPFKKYVGSKGIDLRKVAVVKESINLDFFFPEESKLREEYKIGKDATIIMFHGAIEKSKGVEVLVAAAKKLIVTHPNLYFFIIGNGTAFNTIKAKVEKGTLKQRIILTGWVDFKKIPYFINGADIGIALRNDNRANHFVVTTALMQYWACEKPVLAPNLDSIKEIVIEGENGIMFDGGNSNDLAAKIECMLKMKNKWAYMGENGRKIVRVDFEKTKIAKEMVEVLTQFSKP